MAKKSATARQASASRRLAAAAKGQGITLVKAPGAATAGTPDGAATRATTPSTPASRPATTPTTPTARKPAPAADKSRAPATRPSTTQPVAPAARTSTATTPAPTTGAKAAMAAAGAAGPAAASKASAAARPPAPRSAPPLPATARVTRSPRTMRTRPSGMVTPEHYGYVRHDLRLIFTLALIGFVVLVGLYFYLHGIGQA